MKKEICLIHIGMLKVSSDLKIDNLLKFIIEFSEFSTKLP